MIQSLSPVNARRPPFKTRRQPPKSTTSPAIEAMRTADGRRVRVVAVEEEEYLLVVTVMNEER
jgi:hypothetical protein